MIDPAHPPAVVVGLCAHGLGIARALHGAGVPVHALEANPQLPGLRTACARIHPVADINGEGLVDALLRLAPELGDAGRPVLLLTNDRMAETIGRHVDEIERHYVLSWGHAAARLLPLLHKQHIEERCGQTGIAYPRTVLVKNLEQLAQQLAGLRFPVIAKPVRPVSAFKTIVAHSAAELDAARPRLAQSMPVIVQEFIPGDDGHIRFGALYLDRGRVVARFEGRKLRSRPMGHTTIAVSEPSDEVNELAVRFFEGLELSGPVSLELKKDADGTSWVIEPTVGRTDFWVGLCIANGVNLPLIEYRVGAGLGAQAGTQTGKGLWINGERDPAALGWLLLHHPAFLVGRPIKGVYAERTDPAPFALTVRRRLRKLPGQALRAVRRLLPAH
ncbi:carboxylate--amine ligase [Pseudothauera rhizosphaerae]|uniref:ATP-grasp domain-containing protein n=1 Tax=Pseudothauera rhizosphaerae TaxID=2565932 RepID=A0A4S4APJ9_9RHOO|nr:hypothetical protein [Pseudothauera rhizosphaerae]THF61616.1 hypothetical protein E6O51_09175 [Pseudothauera rhizosphaerae]